MRSCGNYNGCCRQCNSILIEDSTFLLKKTRKRAFWQPISSRRQYLYKYFAKYEEIFYAGFLSYRRCVILT